MATIRDGRISTTFNYNKIKAIPELGLPALKRQHSADIPSVSSVVSSTADRTEDRKVNRAEPCLITKQHGYSLELAHFINAVRRDPDEKYRIVSRGSFVLEMERSH